MKIDKSKRNNIIFLILMALMIIPQTRLPIQVMIHKGLSLIGPSNIDKEDRVQLAHYAWELEDINGVHFNFKEIKGKVVLINFWATWCPPCIAEMSSMQRLYEDYKEKVKFVFVTNESSNVVESFLNKKNYSIPVYKSITTEPDELETSSIPRTFLIDKNGEIVIDKTGASNWNSKSFRETIDNLLK